MKSVCILLVLLRYVHHEARFRKREVNLHLLKLPQVKFEYTEHHRKANRRHSACLQYNASRVFVTSQSNGAAQGTPWRSGKKLAARDTKLKTKRECLNHTYCSSTSQTKPTFKQARRDKIHHLLSFQKWESNLSTNFLNFKDALNLVL